MKKAKSAKNNYIKLQPCECVTVLKDTNGAAVTERISLTQELRRVIMPYTRTGRFHEPQVGYKRTASPWITHPYQPQGSCLLGSTLLTRDCMVIIKARTT
ncbi:unnamed protein product [Urochloa humidicola]